MKKFSIIYIFVFVLSLAVYPAFAVQYGIDVLEDGNPGGWTASLKTFDDNFTVDQCQQIDLDIWVNDVPANANAGGFWVDFSGSTDKISYISAGRALTDGSEGPVGPWPPGGVLVDKPAGAGTIMGVMADLGAGAAPDADGDIFLGRVTLGCIGSGTAHITVSVVPSVATWAPIPTWDDADVGFNTVLISFPSPSETTTSVPNPNTSSTIPSNSTTTTLKPVSTTTSTSFATTTTSKPLLPCLAEELYGKDSEETELLRNLRDNILSRTPSGKEIIKAYYRWNPLMVKAIKDDEEFKKQLRQTIDVIILLMKAEKN